MSKKEFPWMEVALIVCIIALAVDILKYFLKNMF